jgi:hypothetical protein
MLLLGAILRPRRSFCSRICRSFCSSWGKAPVISSRDTVLCVRHFLTFLIVSPEMDRAGTQELPQWEGQMGSRDDISCYDGGFLVAAWSKGCPKPAKAVAELSDSMSADFYFTAAPWRGTHPDAAVLEIGGCAHGLGSRDRHSHRPVGAAVG